MEETEKKLKSMGSLSSSIAPSLFTPGSKPSFSANPSHRSLLSSSGLTARNPRTFTDTSDHIHLYFFKVFLSTFLCFWLGAVN